MRKIHITVVFLFTVVSLIGCSSQTQEWQAFLAESNASTGAMVSRLEKQINGGLIKNATLLKSYGDFVSKQKPEMAEIVDALGADASSSGPVFQGLKSRLVDARTAAQSAPEQGETAVQDVWNELQLISAAASPDIYGMMLTDPINVLADMSDGQLARVEAMSKEASKVANNSTDMGAGSQLVGNPHYGSWKTGSSGNSFWAWYGKYALFSSLFRSPIYYDRWSYGRGYSYYNDYGRSHYTSPRQRTAQTKTLNQAKSKFQSTGKTFQSPYAKTKTGAASTVVKPRTSSSAGRSFKSAYQSSSRARTASNASSARSASSRTSRSSSRGK